MADETIKISNPNSPAFDTLRWTLILISLPFGILNFVLPIYGKQIGANAVEIGLLFSSFSLVSLLLRPLVGAGMDHYGRRWFFLAGLGVYGLAMAVFSASTTMTGLLAARVLQGAGSALLWLAASAIVADLAGASERARSYGGVSQATNQGGILGTFIGFSLLFSSGIAAGWKPLFLFYAVASLTAVLIAWRRMPETLPAVLDNSKTGTWQSLQTILRSRALLALMFVGLITGASSAMISPVLMIFLQEKFHAGISELAWAFLPSAIVWAVLPARLGRLADRFGRRLLMVLALFVAAVNSFLMANLPSLPALAALWAIEAVCFAASDPAGQALIADLTGEEQRGSVFGIFTLSGGLGAVIGPLAGGWLYDTASQTAPFLANSAALALSALILWIFLKNYLPLSKQAPH